jgi:homoserine O-succinyltransferase
MPLLIESAPLPVVASLRDRRIQRGAIKDRFRRLRVALVNNMPDSALGATERQFAELISEASGEFDVRLTLAALETLPRAEKTRAAMRESYRRLEELRYAALDAVIITGAEPRSPDLTSEPYWGELTALMEWTRRAVVSALYSCLAAHAAALHRDGILRRRLPRKLSGVYPSEVVAKHELTEGLVDPKTPHSRFNALAECDLEAKGYVTLTRSRYAGPDVFIKDEDLLEVFWQGHPEYDRDTLAREFRRDVLRYFNNEWPRPPRLPHQYFDEPAQARIQSALAKAHDEPKRLETVAATLNPEALSPAVAEWRETATRLMSNWLTAISRRKAEAAANTFAMARRGG